MTIDKAELQAIQNRIDANRAYYEPDTPADAPPKLHRPAQADKYNKTINRYMSIPPVFYEQAGRIAERHPKTYSKKDKPSWQEVIRRAINLGMPLLERPEEQLTAIKQGTELVPMNKAGGAGYRVHCPLDENITCHLNNCKECTNAGHPLYGKK